MIVLSLFDGISCGQLALDRAKIKYKKYFACEIDKNAIAVTKKNFPSTIHLGDIKTVDFKSLGKIDLLIGGSPCQGFSVAGKGLNFEDPRSSLFFEFVKAIETTKPKYFMLENVKMKKEWRDIISKYLGVEPILINSALVSAQNRERYYWTNIPFAGQPEDKNIYLKDIIEYGLVDRDKSYLIDASYFKRTNESAYFEKHRRQAVFDRPMQAGMLDIKGHERDKRVYLDNGKSPCLLAHTGGGKHAKVLLASERGRRLSSCGTKRDDKNGKLIRGYETRSDGKSCALTTVQKDNYILEDLVIRKLTPIECERLQTLPDNYTFGVSNTQRYKLIGNCWTVDIVAYIFKGLKEGL